MAEEEMDALEQAWFNLAVLHERIKVERKIAKLWEKHSIQNLEVIFHRGRLREKHDPFYAAMRKIIRDLTLRKEEVTPEDVRVEFDKMYRETALDPGKLMDVASEFGIVPADPAKFSSLVEEWRRKRGIEEDVIRQSAAEVAKDIDHVIVKQAFVKRRKNGKGTGKGKYSRRGGRGGRARTNDRSSQQSRAAQPKPREADSLGNGQGRG